MVFPDLAPSIGVVVQGDCLPAQCCFELSADQEMQVGWHVEDAAFGQFGTEALSASAQHRPRQREIARLLFPDSGISLGHLQKFIEFRKQPWL
jgi:hypothetical protein